MIQINDNFKKLIPPLTESEYAELEQSILAEGCREALITWNGWIVDGHHRYEICTKHNLPFRTQEKDFKDEGAAEIWILTNQLGRRNISDFVRIELALKRKDLLLEQGREKKQIAGKEARDIQLGVLTNWSKPQNSSEPSVLSTIDKSDEPHNTRQIMAKELKVGQGTIERAEVIIKHAPEELKQQLRTGKASINEAYIQVKKQLRQAKAQQKREELAEAGKDIVPDERWHIWQADIATWQAPKQYDFIITDPPYPKEYIYLYEVLAQRATEWLKPGGLLLAMCGESYLNQIMPLMDKHLEYYWIGCILTPDQNANLWQKKVKTKWKPLLIYTNGNYNGKVFTDVFKGENDGKELHEWQQSESVMDAIIGKICYEGQSILDPFCGSGTTGVAALKQGCFFDGIDIDENNVNISKARLANGQ